VQPGPDRKAAGRRIGPGLREDHDDPHVGLKGLQDAHRRLAVGLIEETQRVGIVVPGMFDQGLVLGGDYRRKIGPGSLLTLLETKNK
jgi:hypothetical protein